MLNLNSGRGTPGITEVGVVEMLATGKVRVINTTQTVGEIVKCEIFKAKNSNLRLINEFQRDVRLNLAYTDEDFDVLEFAAFANDSASAKKLELEYVKKYDVKNPSKGYAKRSKR